MWFDWFFFISLFVPLSCSFQSGELIVKMNTLTAQSTSSESENKDKFINPNDWSHNGHYKAKDRIERTPYDHDAFQLERQSCKSIMAERSSEKTIAGYSIARRFINLLLQKSHFEDLAGNTVPLDSISSSTNEKLLMSFMATVSPKEVQILLEFGQKKSGQHVRQIDEILTKLISSQVPNSMGHKCWQIWFWMEDIGNAWLSLAMKIDVVVVVYIAVVAYIIWSVKLTLNGEGSWKNLIFCFMLPSIVWEFSKLLQEENVKQYSEELRLGELPGYCFGIDNRWWWEKWFAQDSEAQECAKYHSLKMTHPALRVPIFKVILSHLQQLMGIVVTLTRELTASSRDDGFITNIIMRTVTWLSIVLAIVGIVAFYILSRNSILGGGMLRRAQAPPGGSRVEPVEPSPEVAVEETVKPPPRRRNNGSSRGKRRPVEQVDGNPRPLAHRESVPEVVVVEEEEEEEEEEEGEREKKEEEEEEKKVVEEEDDGSLNALPQHMAIEH